MADENKPAFYPRVGRNIAKNFRSAQPEPFVDDPRAMDLPQFGDADFSVPSKANLELSRRIAQRDADLKRQQDADMSPLEKVAGALQAARFMGSALTQGINSLPTRAVYGDEAADKFMQDRIYKPTQPKALEYAGDIGDFLEKLETEYKLPQVLPEAVALQYLSGPAKSQAMQAAIKQGMKLEKRLDPIVTQALERGGLQRDLLLGLAQGAQSNVIKPAGGNWLAGSPDRSLDMLLKAENLDNPEQAKALNNWIGSNLSNYVKKQMGTPEDPVRALHERGISHLPQDLQNPEMMWTPEELARDRKMQGFPEEGVAINPTAQMWEQMSDQAIIPTKAREIQEYPALMEKRAKALEKYHDYESQIDDRLVPFLMKKGLDSDDIAGLLKLQSFEKANILGDKTLSKLFREVPPYPANEQFMRESSTQNPWLSKVDPNTSVYSGDISGLGFDHILDVLREDVAAGRIRPEQLNKVSMEQAVRRTYEYDQEMAKRMAETQLKQQEGFPLHKEYPEGYKWIELTRPEPKLGEGETIKHLPEVDMWGIYDPQGGAISSGATEKEAMGLLRREEREKQLADALKYEGDTMGHCVGGYCPDVLEGRTRIFSLRDAKGEPHVTVETRPSRGKDKYYTDWVRSQPENIQDEITSAAIEYNAKNPNLGYGESLNKILQDRLGPVPDEIIQIKGKQNAKPKEDYIPYVQDFVKSGNWSDVGDIKNTDLIRAEDVKKAGWDMTGIDKSYLTKQEYDDILLKQRGNPPPEGMKRGGVAISKNPDTMMLELGNQKMKNGVPAYSVAGAVIKQGLKAASEAERALPLRLPRATPKSLSEINAHAERVARQIMGEHVTSGKAGDTKNLAGRSMKESQRVKGLEYELVPTKDVPESKVVESKIGDINVALPGDFTVSDVELKSLMGEPIGSRQEGGSRYGLGHINDETPLFYASGEGQAQQVQDKVTDLYNLYGPERVMGHHMAMGPTATNFAQHFADANLRRIDYSKLRPADMNMFDQIMAGGYEVTKKNKKGESFTKIVDFPNWPGIADPQAAYEAMRANPEMRKFFNKISQTPSITQPLGFPNAQDVRYAITSPDLRDMEVNLTGHGIGRMVPGGALTDTADHNTYLKGIQGIYDGHQDVLSPFVMSFADAAEHIMSTQRPQDFTSTIQKVFPHQRVDQQFIDEMEQYRRRVKELTGKKKGGTVHKAAGGKVTPQVKKADGGAINYNTAPDMSDGGRIIQGAPFKRGGKVNMTTSRDTMFMELSDKKLKRK